MTATSVPAAGPSAVLRRAARYGWLPLAALAATVALEQGERQSLAQAVDGIEKQFHISDSVAGTIPFAMAMVAVIGAIPFGVLADRLRRVRLLAGAMVVWAACMALNGLATSFAVLFVYRLGVGIVEANSPAAVSLVADYYPAKDRARSMGLYQSGALAGALLGLVGGGVAVSLGGWRWAFFMWVPIGLAVAVFMLRQPEPRRGDQDADLEADLAGFGTGGLTAAEAPALLPSPRRTGAIDYDTCSHRDVMREFTRIPTMWFGVLAITVSQVLLTGLQFWAVPYFKRVHHLGAAAAGGVAGLLGLGSVLGILGGGFIADRYFRRGHLNARVYVVAFGSIAAAAVITPAFASTSLTVAAPLMFIGGALLTLPVAPAEALFSDVVVAQLRGRAATVRSIVRSLSNGGAAIIGVLSAQFIASGLSRADGLRYAIVAICPIYAVGGVIMLLAARTYPADVAFVVAESRRCSPEPVGSDGVRPPEAGP
jgi:MFS family permease